MAKLLRQCVFSILGKTAYQDYEILLVNNQSREESTQVFLEEVKNNSKIKIIDYNKPFNFSAINNFAAKKATGEYILFLNNDTEVISPDWIEKMLSCISSDKKIGAVGAKLLYPNNTIQHCGVLLDKKNLAIHKYRAVKDSDVKLEDVEEFAAVTGACMLTRKSLFLETGGFDELNFPIAYNDVDYCLRIGKMGYKIVCVSSAKLYHYESASRKSDVWAKIFNRKRYKKFIKEQTCFRDKWEDELK